MARVRAPRCALVPGCVRHYAVVAPDIASDVRSNDSIMPHATWHERTAGSSYTRHLIPMVSHREHEEIRAHRTAHYTNAIRTRSQTETRTRPRDTQPGTCTLRLELRRGRVRVSVC